MKRTLFTIAATCLLAASQELMAQSAPQLTVKFDSTGLGSLLYGQEELLAPKATPTISVTGEDDLVVKTDPASNSIKQANGTITRTNGALEITTVIRQDKNNLLLAVTYQNKSAQPIAKIDDSPLVFRFPKRPAGNSWKWGYSNMIDTNGSPGVMTLDWGKDKLVICVEPGSAKSDAQDTRPMSIGFGATSGDVHALLFKTQFKPALQPGKQWTFQASLRFASSAIPTTDIARDIYDKFSKAYPFTLNWPDRRPIGTIFLGQSAMKWPTNPRGWFNDPKLDVTTAEGKQVFHDRLMKVADTCIAEIKKNDGQGMIFWDVEGDEMPHAITYMGDPRIVPQADPEMDACADEFFKKFIDAGLKTGVCLRPSRIIPNPNGGWKHQQVDDHVAELADKIAYAKKRWGCTIFYMDTNVKWPMNPDSNDSTRGMWGKKDATVLPASDMVELCRRHPDVLIFPEYASIGYYSVCSRYHENGSTSDEIRAVYPKALTVTMTKDVNDYLSNWDRLRAAVIAGDIHLFPSWYGDSLNPYIKRMYQDADFFRRAALIQNAVSLESALKDADPLVRYAAVSRTTKPDMTQTALLIKALNTEGEWVVQRQIVQALGRSGDATAVPVLATLLQDPKKGLDRFATPALGSIGAPATQTLLGIATGSDPRMVPVALEALSQNDDPAAIPTLLTLTASGKTQIRVLAIRALSRRPTPEVTAKLVAMLEESPSDKLVLKEVCISLGKIKDPSTTKPLVSMMTRSTSELKDNTIRTAACDALEAVTGLQYGTNESQWKKAIADGKI